MNKLARHCHDVMASRPRRDLVIAAIFLLTLAFFGSLKIGRHFFDWTLEGDSHEILEFSLIAGGLVLGWYGFRRSGDYLIQVRRHGREIERRELAEAELRQTRNELEARVKERTGELEREVAEHLRAEQALRVRQTQLTHMNRLSTMGEMAITLAHEVSQPLSAINGYAGGCIELLRSGTDQRDQLKSAVSSIINQTRRVQDILGQARAKLQPSASVVMSTDLNALVRETAALVEMERLKHDVELVTELAEDLPNVRADGTQIQQVLMNLALNAIEAMTEHGTPDKRLRIRAARHGADAVEITVQDSGPGLAGSMLDEVFEPFYTTKEQGLGMGLAICRSIIEGAGGRLWASSDGVAGATFHVRLPAET